jgi:hypothetical protein
MRRVEIAVGFPDYTWSKLQLEVAEDPNYVLDDDEAKERAVAMAKEEFSSVEVTFLQVLYIEPLDDMEGVV